MAKLPTIATIVAGFGSYTQHNANYTAIQNAFSNTLSRDGSTPNTMEADFDLNSNDLLNGGTLNADDIVIDGTSLIDQVNAAAASAAAAASSASSAATAATSAATSFDNFDDRYLGAKASAPTVDNDGNALLVGALYFNTTDNNMYVWNGSTWGNLTVPVSFLDLDDVPAAYTGGGGKFLRVNVGETGIEFAASSSSIADDDYGDIVVSSSGTVWSVDAGVLDTTHVAASALTGADLDFVTGTAGTSGNFAVWNVDGDIVNGPDLLDEDDFASDSNTDVATQQSIKAYVDAAVAGVATVAGQIVVGTSTTAGSTSTAIPFDNTIPQNTEGAEVVTVAITPANAGSTILIEATVTGSLANNGDHFTGAIFVDSEANSIGANCFEKDSSCSTQTLHVVATHAPGDTNAHTYKLRVGPPSGGTAYWNRTDSTANIFSTAGPIALIKVTEILP